MSQRVTLGLELRSKTLVNDIERKAALDHIRQNIAERGYHTYVIAGGGNPHYAYTIGLSKSLGAELILAGAYFYLLDELPKIIDRIVEELHRPVAWEAQNVDLGRLGSFSLRKVHMSWAATLMMGALDFYQIKEVEAFQIVPDAAHWTI